MDEKPWWKQSRSAGLLNPADELPDAEEKRRPDSATPDLVDETIAVRRAWWLFALFVLVIVAIILRLAYWSMAGPPLPALADDTGEPIRGRIVDSAGLLLATDGFSWEVYARPQGIKKEQDGAKLTVGIATALGQPLETIQAGLAVTSSQATLWRDADPRQREAIAALGNPSLVWTADRRVRQYPLGQLGAHLIGFTDYGRQGIYGVEAGYDAWLLGQSELPAKEGTAKAVPMPEEWRVYLPSPGRHDLVLHMNAALQHLVEERLAEAIETHRAEAGTIIVMNPRNGSILALANYPTYEPDQYLAVRQENWTNQAISSPYEPGSVFKLITLAAALDTGQITPDKVYTDTGRLEVDGQTIHNAENKSYGTVAVRQVLAKSINVVTARICLDMGADTFYRYVRQFGFARLTEVDLSLEHPGEVKEPGNPYWSRLDLATNSFGQALTVTPLQMINAVAAIANGGTRQQPQVGRALIQDGQMYEVAPRVLGYPIKPQTAYTMTQMMVYTVDSASYAGFVPGYRVAGKTGTAEISTAKGYTQETIASFVGFLPAADPQIIILVKLDKPKSYRWAEQTAVPVFAKVAQDAVRLLHITPDNRMP